MESAIFVQNKQLQDAIGAMEQRTTQSIEVMTEILMKIDKKV